jgi:hypothetical protein
MIAVVMWKLYSLVRCRPGLTCFPNTFFKVPYDSQGKKAFEMGEM